MPDMTKTKGGAPTMADALIDKARRREALFGIVGLGYVGLPLAVELAAAGYRVLGFDISDRVVDGLNAGRSHVKDVTDEQLGEVVRAGRFEATTDMSRLREPDAISICVPTPLSKFKDPDVSYIVAATEAVKLSSWPSAPSGWILVTPPGRPATPPRWWVALRPPAPVWRARSTSPPLSGWFRSRPPRPPSW